MTLLGSVVAGILFLTTTQVMAEASVETLGRALFVDAKKGNCIACHRVQGDAEVSSQATVGPILKEIKQRFPDPARLRSLLWDAGSVSPNTIMPPYGRHRILTEAEIEALARYLENL
ncbi:MAG: sulfur oxidation c-type cytochrome SoxX [Betaproteobacteria bacterium]|nr:sulfur oxidation c-type cytochrome SoxX [Betaproteobacteria bacterium]